MPTEWQPRRWGQAMAPGGGGGGVRGQQKVCVPKVDLQFRSPLMIFIFCRRKFFLMRVGGRGSCGGARAAIPPLPPFNNKPWPGRGIWRPHKHMHTHAHFIRGRLKRSARAVQLFGRLAEVETHTLWYFGHHCCLVVGFDALGMWHFLDFHSVSPISTFLRTVFAHFHHTPHPSVFLEGECKCGKPPFAQPNPSDFCHFH